MTMPKNYLCLGGNIYEFEGWRFEWHSYHGPWPLQADSDKPVDLTFDTPEELEFWQMIERFRDLPATEREGYLVLQGGCIEFE